ncbi:submandibular gland secretory Glx-rich protein CB-like [Mus pahari]|uniref:submandibular gland secretory Glx-rich protein CB-like n=1 Tax=Mus pahari TaxID=10093 RepID=UPI000A304A48|nr:submandibular gland secretory Glx-rich protein CB-like [Mus pahari]
MLVVLLTAALLALSSAQSAAEGTKESSGPFYAAPEQQAQNSGSDPSSADTNTENVQEDKSAPAENESSANSGSEQEQQEQPQETQKAENQVPSDSAVKEQKSQSGEEKVEDLKKDLASSPENSEELPQHIPPMKKHPNPQRVLDKNMSFKPVNNTSNMQQEPDSVQQTQNSDSDLPSANADAGNTQEGESPPQANEEPSANSGDVQKKEARVENVEEVEKPLSSSPGKSQGPPQHGDLEKEQPLPKNQRGPPHYRSRGKLLSPAVKQTDLKYSFSPIIGDQFR